MTTDAVPTRWPRLRSTWWLVIPVAAVAWSVVRADDEENARMRRPLMVPEAKLPSGFPPPGPVNEVVLKTYPAHRLARVATAGAQGGDGMFMNLFRHIERNEIAMTAPVEMVWEAEPAGVGPGARQPRSMAFLYGRSDLGTPGPDPADPQVVVEDIAEIRVISVGIRGGYGRPALDKGLEMLRAWLAGHPEWVASGSPRTLAYNSPFVPNPLKYSEVQLPVEPAAPGDTTRPQPPPDRR